MSIIIGIDHGYYAIKTAHCSFPAGLTSYGEHEPYTRQGLLEFGGCFFICGSGRQPIQRDKTINDNYYLLTLAAIAKEIQQRGLPPECSVRIAAGLPLTSFGRDKPKFRDYLLRSNQPVNYKFEGVEYSITIEEVAIFPQGYAALMTEVGLLQDEPSMLLMDLGGWTVDLMRIDNAIPAADTAHSLELGMIRCVDDIREQVRRETGLSLTDAQIENMLAGQPCTVSETVRDIVNRQGRKYTEHLLSATMEAGFDLHAIPAVLLGGGASVVSRHLSPKDSLCKTIFLLDDKVNAVGFERALTAVSRRKIEACPKHARQSGMGNTAKRFVCKSAANQGGTYAAGLFRSFAEVVEKTSGMGCRAYKTPALPRRRKVAHHAGKKESLVGMAAAAAHCMVGSVGGGLLLAAGHENNGSVGCTEQRTGRAVCVGVGQQQPALFAGVHGDLRGSGYRGSYRPEEHPPRCGAWLGGVGRCVPLEQVLHGQARAESAADATLSHWDRWLQTQA